MASVLESRIESLKDVSAAICEAEVYEGSERVADCQVGPPSITLLSSRAPALCGRWCLKRLQREVVARLWQGS